MLGTELGFFVRALRAPHCWDSTHHSPTPAVWSFEAGSYPIAQAGLELMQSSCPIGWGYYYFFTQPHSAYQAPHLLLACSGYLLTSEKGKEMPCKDRGAAFKNGRIGTEKGRR